MAAFFADPLRLALLAASVALVIGIYVYAKASPRRAASSSTEEAKPTPSSQDIYKMLYNPELDGELGVILKETRTTVSQSEPVSEPANPTGPQISTVTESRLVVIYVMAGEGQGFEGERLLPALLECRLSYGKHKIFHYFGPNDEPVFSVANIVEPGYLDVQEQSGFSTRGLVFFMNLPGPIDGQTAFARMVAAAERIAARLGGEVCDEAFKPLSHDAAAGIHNELAQKPASEPQPTASLK